MTSKRLFDLLVTASSAVLWIPAILVTALAILVLEGRPIFYCSKRVVGRGQVVRIPKFRTMVRNAESVCNRDTVPVSDGIRFLNVPPDSRLYTPIGRVIERFAFTELPQLFCVLSGRMSLVGSRPLPENVMASLAEAYRDVEARVDTPAGMTGLVQLVGRENLGDEQRLDLERLYCAFALRHNTWGIDLKILFYTVLAALRMTPHLTVEQASALLTGPKPELDLSAQSARAVLVRHEGPQEKAKGTVEVPRVLARSVELNEATADRVQAKACAAE
jgi:lipopolysaccharide/colanic/teichoic acid biosynthesis glycosyltransferase